MRRFNTGYLFVSIIVIIAVVVTSILVTFTEKQIIPPTDETLFCNSDSDCVPAQCCHPTSAVNKNFAPNCKGLACTLDCRAGTIDCGNGEIKCIDSKCTAVIKGLI